MKAAEMIQVLAMFALVVPALPANEPIYAKADAILNAQVIQAMELPSKNLSEEIVFERISQLGGRESIRRWFETLASKPVAPVSRHLRESKVDITLLFQYADEEYTWGLSFACIFNPENTLTRVSILRWSQLEPKTDKARGAASLSFELVRQN